MLVRINADEALWREDTGAALSAGCDGLVIPKVESAADVQRVAALAEARGARALHLQAIVETPRALLHLGEIAHASPRLTSLAFGGEDFATALDVAPCLARCPCRRRPWPSRPWRPDCTPWAWPAP